MIERALLLNFLGYKGRLVILLSVCLDPLSL
jgi:hypothetical protein